MIRPIVASTALSLVSASALAMPFDLSGTWIQEGTCECKSDMGACKASDPSLDVFVFSFVDMASVSVATNGGKTRTYQIYKRGQKSADLVVRESDSLSFKFEEQEGHVDLRVENLSLSLRQAPWALPLALSRNQEGGQVGGPAKITTMADESGLVSQSMKTYRTRETAGGSFPAPWLNVTESEIFMIKKASDQTIEVGSARVVTAHTDGSSREFNLSTTARLCKFARK